MTDAQSSLADFHAPSDVEAFALSIAPLAAAFKVFEEPCTMDVQTSPDADLCALDAACARGLGWTEIVSGDDLPDGWRPHGVPPVGTPERATTDAAGLKHVVPAFSADPTVLEDEVKKRGLSDRYTLTLFEIVNGVPWGPDVTLDEVTRLTYATPAQRARAFVEVMKGQQIHANSS